MTTSRAVTTSRAMAATTVARPSPVKFLVDADGSAEFDATLNPGRGWCSKDAGDRTQGGGQEEGRVDLHD
jgi:hypothetical protein